MGMNDNYTCLWKFRIKSTPIKCIGSALWYTSIRSHGGLWRSPQFVRVCCSIAELRLLTFFVSLLKRRPEEWLACRVFFEEVLCRVIQWDLNGVSLRATVSLSVTVGITIRCGSEVYLVAAMVVFQNPHLWWNEWGMCLRKCFIIIASRGSHPEKALLWPWQPGFAHHTQKNILTLCARCRSGEDVYVQTAIISSCGRKKVVSRRMTSCHSFPAVLSSRARPVLLSSS